MIVNATPWPSWYRRAKPRAAGDVITYAARLFEIPRTDIFSASRAREHVTARHAVFYALHRRGLAYTTIGRVMKRDHSTIIHGVAQVIERMKRDEYIFARVADVLAYAEGKPSREVATGADLIARAARKAA